IGTDIHDPVKVEQTHVVDRGEFGHDMILAGSRACVRADRAVSRPRAGESCPPAYDDAVDSPGGLNISGGNGLSGLRLDPFRAITYADHDSLPNVTSPPYDVVGPDGIAALEAADPHNIV